MPEGYYSFASFLSKKFPGEKIIKIPLNAGFSCPNRDGALGRDGCIFCDPYGSGPVEHSLLPLAEQIERFRRRHSGKKFIAYFQAFSNTYAPVATLAERFAVVKRYPDILGLFIGTRPDTVSAEAISLLAEWQARTYLTVELGLQSIHQRSLDFLNRRHSYQQFLETLSRLRQNGIPVVVHLIIGIPGESLADMLATVAAMNRLRPAGVKFHLFHVLRGSRLHELQQRQPVPLLEREEYVRMMVAILAALDPDIVVHRLTGERQRELFIAPLWALDKAGVLQDIRRSMSETGIWQGKAVIR